MSGSLNIRISERDAAYIIQALNQRLAVLPTSSDGVGENEFGSWVDRSNCAWLVNYLTDRLSESVAHSFAPFQTRAYWSKVERAKSLVVRFVWPFKRKEVA